MATTKKKTVQRTGELSLRGLSGRALLVDPFPSYPALDNLLRPALRRPATPGGHAAVKVVKRYTGRTSKFETSASIESFV